MPQSLLVLEMNELEACLDNKELGEITPIFDRPVSPWVEFMEMAYNEQEAKKIKVRWTQVVHMSIKVVPILWSVDSTTDYSTLWNDLQDLCEKFQELGDL